MPRNESSTNADTPLSISTIIEAANNLRALEQSARKKIADGEEELRKLRARRDAVRQQAEKVVDALTPKRQRRRKADSEQIADIDAAINSLR